MINRKEIIKQGHHWLGETPLPDSSFGFLYVVLNIKNKKLYIGKKHYKGRRNRKNGTYYEVNNKWEFYTSSSKYVNQDIEKYKIENFVFILLKNYEDDESLAKAEEDMQIELNVLHSKIGNDYLFYNKNINGKFFRPLDKINSIHKQPLSDYKGENNPMFGKTHTEEAKKIMSESSKNRVSNPESYKQAVETKDKKRKVYKFYHKEGYSFIGTKEQLCEKFSNVKIGGIKELILGRVHDKTCVSGYSKVHSRYGWIKAELIGIAKNLEDLRKQYGEN